MDGFASSVAALNVDSMKTTFDARPPVAVIGDTGILSTAPYPMIAAGLGDLLGKFTCLCDWKLARIITGEHYCERIVELVERCVQSVLADAPRAKDRDPAVLGDIMEGLVLTGVAMSLYGNSRPASGCEHHISHYWEMIFEQQGRRPVPHGAQVGVGTVLILKLTEALLDRLKLTPERIEAMAEGLRQIAALPDPVILTPTGKNAQSSFNAVSICGFRLTAGGVNALKSVLPRV